MATTSNAALQAVVDKIARMAVRKEPPDLRYDVNKDGRITSQDAFLVSTGRATIPTVEQNAASQNTSPQAGTGSTASDQGTWEWVWNQYTSLGEHGVLKNTKTGEQVLTEPRSVGDKQGIQQLAEPLTSLLNDPEFSGYAKIHSTIPLSAIGSGIPVPLDSLKDPRSYDDTWKAEFRKERQISNLMGQLAQYINPSSSGGAWSTQSGRSSGAGFGPEGFLKKMAENFINQTGLTDLNKLGVRTTTEWDYDWGTSTSIPYNVTTYYNKDTGKPVNFNGTLGGYGEGPGWTYTRLTFEGDRPVITTTGEDSSDLGSILPIISIALLAVPGIGQAIGSAILPTGVSTAAATAVGNAVVNAGLQVAAGVPVENAVLNSAASLGVSQLVPNLSGNVYVDNAVKSVATAALTGGDVGNALANSLIATGGNELLGNTSFTGDKVVDSAIASAITSGVQAAATGGDVGASIIRGGIAGASGQIAKEERMAESARSGTGFVGEDVTEPDAALQVDPEKILRMAVLKEPPDLRYDVNKDGRITSQDAFLVYTGRATIPTVEQNAASQITSPQDQVDTGSTLNVADVIGNDTVTAGSGIDSVNAGVAQDKVLDLVQQDIDRISSNNVQDVSNVEQEVQPVTPVEPGIDPRILAQGVTGGQFGEGGFLQTGGNIGVNVLPPNPQSEFGVQKNINARADFNESSLGAKYGEINSPHWGKLISSIMINDVVDANGNPIDTPVGYYAIYDPDTKSTFYEFSLSDGTTVTSKTRPFVEQGKIFSEDKFYELKPSRQPTELNIDTGAGNGAFLGGTEDLVEEPVAGITISASKPTIDQRLLDLVEQAPDQESATNATVAYYQALDNDLSDDEALNAAKTAMQAKSPEILFKDSIVEQQPTEQQVADTGLTVVGQPVNQTPVVSPTTPSVTPPTIAPVVTEPVVDQPVVTEPSVTQPEVTTQIDTGPVFSTQIDTGPVFTTPDISVSPVVVNTDNTLLAKRRRYGGFGFRSGRTAPVTQPTGGEVVSQDAGQVVGTESTLPSTSQVQPETVTQTQPEIVTQVTPQPEVTPEITPQVTPTPPPLVIEPTPPTSEVTGIVLQNNGDGTALVLTNDGNAANVPATDAVSNEPLTPGSSVTIDQNTNTATVTPPASDGGAQAPIVSAPPTVQDTGDQQVLGNGQQPTTDAGSIIDTAIGLDTSTPIVPEPVVQESVVQEPPSPPPAFPTIPEEPITEPLQEPVVDKTEEDLLLEQIIRELEPTPPVSEGVPIQEPEFPEPPLVLPESPTIDVADGLTVRPVVDRLTVRPVVDRGYRRPPVIPGSRVEESAQILPLRPGLSEGGTGGIEGTTEQEQEPVWNVRSLKLRRLLGI